VNPAVVSIKLSSMSRFSVSGAIAKQDVDTFHEVSHVGYESGDLAVATDLR
jgi:hypothetical protein